MGRGHDADGLWRLQRAFAHSENVSLGLCHVLNSDGALCDVLNSDGALCGVLNSDGPPQWALVSVAWPVGLAHLQRRHWPDTHPAKWVWYAVRSTSAQSASNSR
jgi:hypothetical protein